MSGANAFFVLIPAMYLLFAVALAIIAAVERRLISARWAAPGFAVACVSILIDGLREPGLDQWASWARVMTHYIPLLVMVQAFLSRHQRSVHLAIVAMAGVSAICVMPSMFWALSAWMRGVVVQATCFVIIASALPALWSYRKNSGVDLVALLAIGAAAFSYAGRTAVIYYTPIGVTEEAVGQFYSDLNIAFHSASALMGMFIGIVLMMTIGFDIVRMREQENEVDPLTKLGNRRQLERIISDDQQGKRSIGGVIAIDLDHFKRVNDCFGHDAGDKVLERVADKLHKMFGELGCVCRTGGEEFVILLDRDNLAAIAQLATSARAAIAGLTFEDRLKQLTITASIGFHLRGDEEDISSCIKRADQAVYCAKTDGRNRVVGLVQQHGLKVMRAVA